MKRRSFLHKSSLLSAPALVGGIPFSAISNNQLSSFINGESDRVLVLIQLNGGNDGLNTCIPLDQFDNLAAVRPNVYIPQSEIIPVTDTMGFHPVMTGMKEIWDDAKLKIIQSVGYPNQNRSHFRSTDIWHTGSSADQYLDSGWMGRYLDTQFADYPSAYPNDDCPDPFAITIGNTVSETCQGSSGNFSIALSDPTNLASLNTPLSNDSVEGCASSTLDFLNLAIQQTNLYSEVLEEKYALGNNLSTKYADNNGLAIQLKTVARLISGGLGTKVYIVSLGGFDTHADQVVDGDTSNGAHSSLLNLVSDAVCAFQDDLNLLGIDKRVLGMTYSEFGRRIRDNFSFGTDHGDAAPLMLFGTCVQAGITGDNPLIGLDISQNEGVPMQYDFRSVYGSVLMDWFEMEESQVQSLFPHDFQYIPITNVCETISSTQNTLDDFNIKLYPNPMSNSFNLDFESGNEWVKISIYNTLGQQVKVISNRKFQTGFHSLNISTRDFSEGAYYLRIQSRNAQKTLRFLKQ